MLCVVCLVKYLGSALMLKMKSQQQKSIGYRVLHWFFSAPSDSNALKELGLAKVSTIIAFTNITYIQYALMCHARKHTSNLTCVSVQGYASTLWLYSYA